MPGGTGVDLSAQSEFSGTWFSCPHRGDKASSLEGFLGATDEVNRGDLPCTCRFTCQEAGNWNDPKTASFPSEARAEMGPGVLTPRLAAAHRSEDR